MNTPQRGRVVSGRIEKHDKPTPAQADEVSANLLAFESAVRELDNNKALWAHFCNPTRQFLGFRQAFVLRRNRKSAPMRVVAASSIAVVERDAPLVRWVEKLIKRMDADVDASGQHGFRLPAYCDAKDTETSDYPFPELLWTPCIENNEVTGGLLIARENVWRDHERVLAERFAKLFSHANIALRGRGQSLRKRLFTPITSALLLALLAFICAVPIPITALAPVEVTPLDPFVVAAPFDGVVKEIVVDPGTPVAKDDTLIIFEDVERRNRLAIADESEAVAQARYQRYSQHAITDPSAKRELAVAKAEYELAQAEKAYAKELLDKTILKAEYAGLSVYTDKRDWVGRPVGAGESIIQIADPQKINFTIDLPVKDSLVLKVGARVKIFLDSDPLNPIEAVLSQTSYQSRMDKRDILSYLLLATMADQDQTFPRIGIQGTAQIFGEKAPLIFAVMRRPLAAFRQITGW